MAPLTSIAFLCLGGLLLVHSMAPSQGPLGILAAVLSALLSAYGLIELVEYLGIPVLSLEEWLFPNPPMMGAIPTGRMSPSTAALLLLSGAIVPMLYLRERGGERQKLFGDLAGCMGILVAVIGTVFVLSYLHGAPFLYGTLTIPMAATTALAFLLLGTGQILAVGPDGFPSRLIAGPSARARLLRVFVSTTVGVVVAIDLMHVYAHSIFSEDNAIMSGVFTAAFAVITGALIARVALKVGDDMDRSEEVRRGAEDKLRESEDRFRDLVEHSQDLICTHDLEGRILSVNPWAAKVLGYAPDELLQMNYRDLLAPKVRQEFGAYVDEIRKHGAAQGLLLIRTRMGEDRILEYNNTLRTDGVTEPIVRGVAHDITERKRAEDGLRKNRNMLAHIMDSIPQSVFWKDRDSVYLGCNKVFARQAGIDNPDEITGKNDFDLPWSQEESEAYRADDREVMENNRPKLHIIETQHQADGSRIWLDTTKIPLKNEAGRVYGVLGVYDDITERKRAEETLTRLGMAVEQAVEAIVITDTEGRIEYVNPAFEHITGYPREEAIGQNMRILKSGRNDESSYRSMWETISRGEVWKGRIINRKKDGTFYDEETTISPVRDVSGKIVNYVSGKRDITRELMLQNQVQAAQRMESVGTLAGGVAHDFNNILTVILGCAEILTVRFPATDPSYQAVEEIRQAANRAAALTRQLLAFGRKQILQPKVIGINSIVTEMDRMLRRLIGEDIDIVTVLEDGLWNVKADPGQIEQVVMNLAVNARDAMPGGGKITIETSNVVLSEEYSQRHHPVTPGAYVMLAISDTGEGMDEKTASKIFEPFFTTKERGKGTGLGLSTVYGIVKQSGGFIWVYSELGKGSTFRVYLPRTEDSGDVPDKTVSPVEDLRGEKTILLVEDDESIRRLAAEILGLYGYAVLPAGDGEEALQLAGAHEGEISLLLTDVVMPRMGGRELYDRIRRQRPKIKVLYMSGYTDNAIVHHGVLDQGTAFLQKPYSPTSLAKKVKEVLEARE